MAECFAVVESWRDGEGAVCANVSALPLQQHAGKPLRKALDIVEFGADDKFVLRIDVSPLIIHSDPREPSGEIVCNKTEPWAYGENIIFADIAVFLISLGSCKNYGTGMFLSSRDLAKDTPARSRRPLASRQWRQTLESLGCGLAGATSGIR